MTERIPDIQLKIWLVPHGIQADVIGSDGEVIRSICRDLTFEYPVSDLKVLFRLWIYALINLFVRAM